MNLKYYILLISSVGSVTVLVFMNSVNLGICERAEYSCRGTLDELEHFLYFFPFILFFSLITFRMKEGAFTSWWKFVRLAVPMIFLFSFIISLGFHHSPGGWFNIDNEIDLVAYFVMYSIFVIGSVVQIYRGYRMK